MERKGSVWLEISLSLSILSRWNTNERSFEMSKRIEITGGVWKKPSGGVQGCNKSRLFPLRFGMIAKKGPEAGMCPPHWSEFCRSKWVTFFPLDWELEGIHTHADTHGHTHTVGSVVVGSDQRRINSAKCHALGLEREKRAYNNGSKHPVRVQS